MTLCEKWVEFALGDDPDTGTLFACQKPAGHRYRHQCVVKADTVGPCPGAVTTVTWETP